MGKMIAYLIWSVTVFISALTAGTWLFAGAPKSDSEVVACVGVHILLTLMLILSFTLAIFAYKEGE